MVKFRKTAILFAAIFILAGSLWADSVTLSLKVEPTSGTLNDDFMMYVTINGTTSAQYPLLSGGDDFNLTLVGPQTKMEIINGQVSQQITYVYQLIPKKPGLLSSPSAEIEIDGRVLRADPVKIRVEKGSGSQASLPGQDVFLRQTVDKKDAYLGEQIVVTLDLYTSKELVQPQFESISFDGFWKESFGQAINTRKYIDGKLYEISRTRFALFPLRTGKITLNQKRVSAHIRVRSPRRQFGPFSDNFFDNFFNPGRLKPVKIISNKTTVNIKPLPPLPDNFPTWNLPVPLVGKTKMRAEVSRTELQTGESLDLTVIIESSANLHPLKNIPLSGLSDFKVYREPSKSSLKESAGRLISKKTIKLTLIPLKAGKITIPAIRIGYFNPETDDYEITASDPIELTVTGQNLMSAPTVAVPQKPVTDSPTQPGLRYNEPGLLERIGNSVSLSLTLMVFTVIVALAVLAYFVREWVKKARPEQELIRAIRNSRTLEDLASTFKNFLYFKLGEDTRGATRDELRMYLMQRVADRDLVFAVQSFLDTVDILLYRPEEKESADLSSLRKQALDIVARF
ncbi:MAG: protein BatD [Candidatus Dadabacteria bacterium]|nr:MAG: protein BatD [Candidatus Dadabacteria bacterium]